MHQSAVNRSTVIANVWSMITNTIVLLCALAVFALTLAQNNWQFTPKRDVPPAQQPAPPKSPDKPQGGKGRSGSKNQPGRKKQRPEPIRPTIQVNQQIIIEDKPR